MQTRHSRRQERIFDLAAPSARPAASVAAPAIVEAAHRPPAVLRVPEPETSPTHVPARGARHTDVAVLVPLPAAVSPHLVAAVPVCCPAVGHAVPHDACDGVGSAWDLHLLGHGHACAKCTSLVSVVLGVGTVETEGNREGHKQNRNSGLVHHGSGGDNGDEDVDNVSCRDDWDVLWRDVQLLLLTNVSVCKWVMMGGCRGDYGKYCLSMWSRSRLLYCRNVEEQDYSTLIRSTLRCSDFVSGSKKKNLWF